MLRPCKLNYLFFRPFLGNRGGKKTVLSKNHRVQQSLCHGLLRPPGCFCAWLESQLQNPRSCKLLIPFAIISQNNHLTFGCFTILAAFYHPRNFILNSLRYTSWIASHWMQLGVYSVKQADYQKHHFVVLLEQPLRSRAQNGQGNHPRKHI